MLLYVRIKMVGIYVKTSKRTVCQDQQRYQHMRLDLKVARSVDSFINYYYKFPIFCRKVLSTILNQQ